MSEQKELTPRLRFELEGTKPEYQERLAELLHFASAMGDYGDPHGVLAVISSVTGKILEREDGKEQKRLDRPDREKAIREILDEITTSRQYGYITIEDKEKAADQILALFSDIEEAKREEREKIGNNLEETIYNKIRHLQTAIEEHGWSRQQTNYDSRFIGLICKQLLEVGNDVYLFRQALKEGK